MDGLFHAFCLICIIDHNPKKSDHFHLRKTLNNKSKSMLCPIRPTDHIAPANNQTINIWLAISKEN